MHSGVLQIFIEYLTYDGMLQIFTECLMHYEDLRNVGFKLHFVFSRRTSKMCRIENRGLNYPRIFKQPKSGA